MPYFRILTDRFSEWQIGDIAAMDDESARVPLERGEIELVDGISSQSIRKKTYSIDKPNAIVGVYLQRFETREEDCASDRIRGEWVIKSSELIEEWNPSKNYDAMIFHLPTNNIRHFNGIKILDICDKVWDDDDFLVNTATIDAITVPTEGLKKELSKVTDKPIYVIPDRHDFEFYSTKVDNKHERKAIEAVWFGYAENSHVIEKFIPILKRNGIALKVISQRNDIPPLNQADTFVKWDRETFIKEVSTADFALLPKNGDLKSNNKEVTAILSGIPVAKTEKDIEKFLDGKKRREAVKNFDISGLKSSKSAEEYLNLIKSIQKKRNASKDIQVYTAICGGYDNDRDDILVFHDKESDRFVHPVMNAKIYKVLPHLFFNAEYSVWVDGNIFPLHSPDKIVKDILGDADMAVFMHPQRNCIYSEHKEAKNRIPEEQKCLIDEQLEKYRNDGMPKKFGLAECAVIIRKHTEVTREFNERWWAEICRYSNRDQMSFPYVWWKMKDSINIKIIKGNVRANGYFKFVNR